MAPSRVESPKPWSTGIERIDSRYAGPPRNIDAIDAVEFAPNLQPAEYSIFGTHEKSKILFLDVQILDSTEAEPYSGDVLIEGQSCIFMTSIQDTKVPTRREVHSSG